MSGMSIASHGRAGKASGMSIGSFGRLYKSFISEIIPVTIAEIMNLVSRVRTVLNMESRIE
jgi:hypothetical protein